MNYNRKHRQHYMILQYGWCTLQYYHYIGYMKHVPGFVVYTVIWGILRSIVFFLPPFFILHLKKKNVWENAAFRFWAPRLVQNQQFSVKGLRPIAGSHSCWIGAGDTEGRHRSLPAPFTGTAKIAFVGENSNQIHKSLHAVWFLISWLTTKIQQVQVQKNSYLHEFKSPQPGSPSMTLKGKFAFLSIRHQICNLRGRIPNAAIHLKKNST